MQKELLIHIFTAEEDDPNPYRQVVMVIPNEPLDLLELASLQRRLKEADEEVFGTIELKVGDTPEDVSKQRFFLLLNRAVEHDVTSKYLRRTLFKGYDITSTIKAPLPQQPPEVLFVILSV